MTKAAKEYQVAKQSEESSKSFRRHMETKMTNDRANLVAFARLVLNGMVDRVTLCKEAQALLRDLGEIK